jgi:riboflavin synthase
MFTGIVQAVGRIAKVEVLHFGRRLTIEAAALGLDDVTVGDSIAVNGACLTVTAKTAETFSVDVVAESLARTAGLDAAGEVNLEKALRFGDRLDGHLVSGHVDATGVVRRFEPRGEAWVLMIEAPAALARFLAYKGSIAVNGVSLTITQVEDVRRGSELAGCRFGIALIPHTVAATTLKHLRVGERVNLEVDLIARYVERMLPADLQR